MEVTKRTSLPALMSKMHIYAGESAREHGFLCKQEQDFTLSNSYTSILYLEVIGSQTFLDYFPFVAYLLGTFPNF